MINRQSVVDIDFVKLINDAGKSKKQVDFTYRLYYNKDTGEPIAYSMEELKGDFVTVTKEQYTVGRYDVFVKDNSLVSIHSINYLRKLVPSTDGIACDKTNVLILDETSSTRWKIKTKEIS
tara:strand:+ start:285 stop:647 length:363 start_codon:yes stop_codon:yes gene_type:complete